MIRDPSRDVSLFLSLVAMGTAPIAQRSVTHRATPLFMRFVVMPQSFLLRPWVMRCTPLLLISLYKPPKRRICLVVCILFRTFAIPFRITGNAEERPANVKWSATAETAGDVEKPPPLSYFS